ncbi:MULTISPECIES: outer membrane beta-barrel protein [unclassified Helicobacter]|uniref:outer membrane beta-barrel protein n=1 Tax=unclassified Helicobacter TaxID=2593540 RepID=UPI000CF16131|nr:MULTISPECIES: outer membrane beta-barrel protein [unclassified Helicobacter]
MGGGYLLASSLQDLEAQNKALELQIKNEELRQKLQNLKNNQEIPSQNKNPQENIKIPSKVFSQPNKDIKRTGLLAGIGLGFVNSKPKGKDLGLYFDFPSHNSFNLNAQIGAMTMWNRYFGLEYYYEFGYIHDKVLNTKMASSYLENKFTGFMITSTLNTNAVMNAYNSDNFGVGFIAGLGLGFDVIHYNQMLNSVDGSYSLKLSSTAFSFDMRANIGLRLIFRDFYAVHIRCSIPFFATLVDQAADIKNNMFFTVGFTYAKF